MPFGEWYCVVCQKTLVVGTVAPRTAMNRHLASTRHRQLAAEQAAKAQAKNPPLIITSSKEKKPMNAYDRAREAYFRATGSQSISVPNSELRLFLTDAAYAMRQGGKTDEADTLDRAVASLTSAILSNTADKES